MLGGATQCSMVNTPRPYITSLVLPLPSFRYDDALKLYNDILQKEPTCAEIWRRKVAVLKAQRDVDEAIKEMNEYLKVYVCCPSG